MIAKHYAIALEVILTAAFAFFMSVPVMRDAVAQPRDAQISSDQLDKLRRFYLGSADNEQLIDSAFVAIDALDADTVNAELIEAYRGALDVMKAKHAFWPRRKLDYVKKGLRTLDAVVLANAENAEIRYLRLISCYYLPRLFGRSWSVQEDFEVLAKSIRDLRTTVDQRFYNDLVRFVAENAELDPSTRKELLAELARVSSSDSATK